MVSSRPEAIWAGNSSRGYNADSVNDKLGRGSIHIRLYGKPDCCLCDRADEVLRALGGEFRLRIEKIDISKSAELLARYGTDIPVATLDGRELFRHRADPEALRAVLGAL